tara:strand:- start:1797 stop:1928 length:132 start_codon:yes stop_codon:yes gene_type:complete
MWSLRTLDNAPVVLTIGAPLFLTIAWLGLGLLFSSLIKDLMNG